MYIYSQNNFIENLVKGYQTLTVDGRGMLGYKIDANEINGGDGQFYLGANLPAREIEVEYMLSASTAEEFAKKIDKLTDVLVSKQFSFYFNDEKDWEYKGTVTGFSQPEKGSLMAKGSFTITCSDPYKYGAMVNKSGGNNLDIPNHDKVLIKEIDFTPKDTIGRFIIANELNQQMIIDGTVNSGNTIKIFPQDPAIIINGVNHSEWFGFASDIENFDITQRISVNFEGYLSVWYRRYRL